MAPGTEVKKDYRIVRSPTSKVTPVNRPTKKPLGGGGGGGGGGGVVCSLSPLLMGLIPSDWGPTDHKIEVKEIVTLASPQNEGDESANYDSAPLYVKGPEQTWDDKLLRQLKGKDGRVKKRAWWPGSGRHVDQGRDAYKPFTHIVRVLHLEDALDVIANDRLKPKNLITFSSLESSFLPEGHPCKNLKVLWFSAKLLDEIEDEHNWYGNVEFAVDINVVMEMFRHCFLVEYVTTPTHTVSRLLLTNKDYSAVLHPVRRRGRGGSWWVTPQAHLALVDCTRYRFKGTNIHDHVVEFLLEVDFEDEKKILSKCEISFMNHEEAGDTRSPHVCNKHQRLHTPCPYPLSAEETAKAFYQKLQEMGMTGCKVVTKLTERAKELLPDES